MGGKYMNKRHQAMRQGRFIEKRYMRARPLARKATKEQDIFDHIDFYDEEGSVDVKGNNLPEEIWLEFKNVQGKAGWMYGKADWISFDLPELGGFVTVLRKNLLEFALDATDMSALVPKNQAYKKLYRRKDREDLITIVTINDLAEVNSFHVRPYALSFPHPLTASIEQIVVS
jgi:hypothetical protein